MKTKILKFEIIGIFFIIFLGTFLHFTFALSGNNKIVGIFSAVNESTWEHFKLAVFPAFFWLLIELKLLKERPKNFLFAKTKGIYSMPFFIALIFYSYKAILGRNYLFLDILTFIIAVILGQILSYKLMFWEKTSPLFNKISLGFLIALLLAFAVFTFYPLNCFLFENPLT